MSAERFQDFRFESGCHVRISIDNRDRVRVSAGATMTPAETRRFVKALRGAATIAEIWRTSETRLPAAGEGT